VFSHVPESKQAHRDAKTPVKGRVSGNSQSRAARSYRFSVTLRKPASTIAGPSSGFLPPPDQAVGRVRAPHRRVVAALDQAFKEIREFVSSMVNRSLWRSKADQIFVTREDKPSRRSIATVTPGVQTASAFQCIPHKDRGAGTVSAQRRSADCSSNHSLGASVASGWSSHPPSGVAGICTRSE